MNSNFPTSPGLYVAQRDCDVVLIKITGMYPTLKLGKGVRLSSLIDGNSIKEASKEILANVVLECDKWSFTPLPTINMSGFPRLSFRPDGNLDLTTEDRLQLRSKYFRFCQSGVSSTTIVHSLMYEYKITMTQALELINQFDKESPYVVY